MKKSQIVKILCYASNVLDSHGLVNHSKKIDSMILKVANGIDDLSGNEMHQPKTMDEFIAALKKARLEERDNPKPWDTGLPKSLVAAYVSGQLDKESCRLVEKLCANSPVALEQVAQAVKYQDQGF